MSLETHYISMVKHAFQHTALDSIKNMW